MPININRYALSRLNNLLSDIEEAKLSDQLRIVRLDRISDYRGRSILGQEVISESKLISTQVAQLLQKLQLVVEGLNIGVFQNVHGYPTYHRVKEVSNHALEWQSIGESEDPFKASYDRSECVAQSSLGLSSSGKSRLR